MNKLLYKIELYLVKVIPMIQVLLSLLNTTLSYFDINTVILSYIGSVSFITLLFLYITSYVFKFCEYHRMFIHYTTITESEHIKNAIWRYIGYEPQRDNDEVDAYLLTYIYNKITDVFCKHDRAAK